MTFVPPYNPETGGWTIFGDPRPVPSAQGMNQSAVVSMAPTRPEALTTQAVLTGDIKEASKFIPLAQQQMQMMHQTNVNNLEIYSRPVDLGGGRFMNCQRNFTADVANIHVPGGGKGNLGALHLNFDPSVMEDFGLQTIFDKNNGLPLYMNEFSGALSQSGLLLSTQVDEEKIAMGTLYHTDTSENINGRTFFIPVVCRSDFSVVNDVSLGDISMGGTGLFSFYSNIMTPTNAPMLGLIGYSAGSSSSEDGVYSVLRVYGPGSGNSEDIKHQNIENYKHIIAYRAIGTDVTPSGSGGTSATEVQEVYVDGRKILEFDNYVSTWGSYYPGNRSMYHFYSGCSGTNSLSIKQKMLYAAHLDDSQIREVTDKLAAKWGF